MNEELRGHDNLFAGIPPEPLWTNFRWLSRIPRQSSHEADVRTALHAWAEARSFESREDGYGNIAIEIPASAGCEDAPTVVLQGHLDMVCEKEPRRVFDFTRDAIQLQIESEWVTAYGTTLGADNGIGLSAALAVAEDESVSHGPLVLLFTIEEELGLLGAQRLEENFVSGSYLLNLDSEEGEALYIGCAGASEIRAQFFFHRKPLHLLGAPGKLSISGLPGGHSGLEINRSPGNAIVLLAELLGSLRENGFLYALASLTGGNSRNSIPRDANAELWVREGTVAAIRSFCARFEIEKRESLPLQCSGLAVNWDDLLDSQPTRFVIPDAAVVSILDSLRGFPQGVRSLSAAVPDLVETSANLAMARTEDEAIILTSLARSLSDEELAELGAGISGLFEKNKAVVERVGGYPGWKPQLDSRLVAIAAQVFQSLCGRHPQFRAIHAGLECGVLSKRLSGIETVSFGPLIQGAHTTEERVNIASVSSFYEFLKALLFRLSVEREPQRLG